MAKSWFVRRASGMSHPTPRIHTWDMHASSCELLDCSINTRQPVLQLCHRGGVGKTHVVVIPKRIPRHHSDPGFVKQVIGHSCGGRQGLSLGAAPKQASDCREDVEGPM